MKKLILSLLTICLAAFWSGAQVPTNGLVGYWPFNGNANDEGGNGLNGTVNGATLTADRFGNPNMAYSFNGTSNYITIPNTTKISNLNKFSIGFWVKASQNTDQMLFLNSNGINGTDCGFIVRIRSGNIEFQIGDGTSTKYVTLPQSINYVKKWTYIVLTYDSITMSAFINDTLKGTNSYSLDIKNTTANYSMGYYPSSGQYFNGIIDDIRIYKRALNQSEVSALYNDTLYSKPQITTNGLVAYWSFTGNANDESGNGINGSVTGATLTTDRFGNANRAYNFNGTSNYITVPNTTKISTLNKFSIGMWVKTTQNTNQILFLNSNGLNGTDCGFIVRIAAGNIGFEIGNGTIWKQISVPQSANYVNKWTYIVLTYDSFTMSAYINDTLKGTNSFSLDIKNTTANYTIGYYPGSGQYFKGIIDEVRIYNRALTQAEIIATYNEKLCLSAQIPANGLAGYWPFIGNANDLSGNGNHGTVYGAALAPDRFGNNNNAYNYNGTSNYIEVPNSPSLNPTALTNSLWIQVKGYYSGSNGGNFVLSKGFDGSTGHYGIYYLTSGTKSFFQVGAVSGGANAGSVSNMITNVWMHICGTYDGTRVKIYVNGILESDVAATGSYGLGSNTESLLFGKNVSSTWPYWVKGLIDDIRIYNRALNQSEILALYYENRCAAPKPIANDVNLCGNSNALLTASGGTNYVWYNTPVGGSSIGTGSTYTTPFLTQNTTYYVANNNGTCESIRDTVTITILNKPKPTTAFSISDSSECLAGNNFIFTNSSLGAISYLWKFGDNSISTNDNPVHSYLAAGTYPVTLISTSQFGCKDSLQKKIYVKQLPNDIDQNKSSGLLRNGLIAYYPFNGNAKDTSGNGNNGTVNGGITLTSDRFGNPKSAYSFDGTDDFIYINGSGTYNIYSIGTWFKTNFTSFSQSWMCGIIFSDNHASGSNRLGRPSIHTASDGTVRVTGGWSGSGSYAEIISPNYVTDNYWHFATAVINNNTHRVSFYVDGSFIKTDSMYTQALNLNNGGVSESRVEIGAKQGKTEYFNGSIDDVGIWNRALTSLEIKALYNQGKNLLVDTKKDSLCYNEGTDILILNSQPGVAYSLRKASDSSLVGITKYGNSDTLVFSTGKLLNTSRYLILAIDTTTKCSIYLDTVITINIRPNPSTSFSTTDTSECLNGNNFIFSNTTTGAISYLWKFGDNTTSTYFNPNHSYTATGTYAVKLTAVSNFNCKDSISKILYVRPHPVSSFTINNNSQCLSGNNFVFTNTATGAFSYLWKFGDAATSTTTSPSHSYATSGSYTIKLISVTNYGCKDSSALFSEVRPQPVTSFTINNNSQCLTGNNFIFTNTTTGASTYLWNFGDASATTTTSPSYSYTAVGAYNVKLVSTTNYGCKDSTIKTLDVRPKPVSSFTVNNNNQCLKGNNFTFTNTSTGASTYIWYFDDSIISIAASPSHTYALPGTFNVKLVSTNSYGCKDSITSDVFVNSPVVNLGKDTTIYGTDTLILNAGSGFDSYLWLDYYTTKTLTLCSTKNGFGTKTIWVKVTKDGCEGYDTIKVTLKLKNSIIEQKSGIEVKVYPNPVSNTLNIELNPIMNEIYISLTDVCGKQLKVVRIMPDHVSSIHQLDVSGLVKGIYYLNISNSEGSKVTKILKL